MKFRPKPLILGSFVTGGIALVVGGGRLLSGYMSTLVIGEIGMPPGLLLIIIGCVLFGFGMGHTTGIMKINQIEEKQ